MKNMVIDTNTREGQEARRTLREQNSNFAVDDPVILRPHAVIKSRYQSARANMTGTGKVLRHCPEDEVIVLFNEVECRCAEDDLDAVPKAQALTKPKCAK